MLWATFLLENRDALPRITISLRIYYFFGTSPHRLVCQARKIYFAERVPAWKGRVYFKDHCADRFWSWS